ncbi:DUF4843 domain-containing protein [Bacteroides reticulotermitis]|nr:DUF4843 domain-containing protein [Bacteroides reticulotermitis]MBB4042953.1 hypothetical protein [Bacteroides reticulotermitis]
MKKIRIIIVSVLAITLWSACENDGFYYQDEPRVRLKGPYEWALNTDSLEFSFASSPSTVTKQEMLMTLHVMGNPVNKDRVANLELVSAQSTATSSQYSIPLQVTVPANQLTVDFTVDLLRTVELQEKTVRLYIKLAESADFKTGVVEQDHFLFKWNDVLSKPKNWETELKSVFGEYSLVKYRFMIDILDTATFSSETMSWAELNNYKIKMRNALTAYNEAHPTEPLKDENGQLVSF